MEMSEKIKKLQGYVDNSQRILALTGAGISTSTGIPDFRSPGSGLYDNLQEYNLPYPEAIFELDYLRINPKPFFRLAAEFLDQKYQATPGHLFIKKLEDSGKLLRLYTQNIDGLDHKAEINRIIECHGSYSHAHCLNCHKSYALDEIADDIQAGNIPTCDCDGIIKPDIVFFGESLPENFFNNVENDAVECDLLIVIGSSLQVYPVAAIPEMVLADTPKILINRESTAYQGFNLEILGNIDDIVSQIT